MIGLLGWLPNLFGMTGNVVGGFLTDRLVRLTGSADRGRKLAFTGAFTLSALSMAMPFVASDYVALALMGLALFGNQWVAATYIGTVGDVVPHQLAGRVNGIAGFGDSSSVLIAQLAIGFLVDRYSFTPVFIGAGLFPLLALASVWVVLGKIERASFVESRGRLVRGLAVALRGSTPDCAVAVANRLDAAFSPAIGSPRRAPRKPRATAHECASISAMRIASILRTATFASRPSRRGDLRVAARRGPGQTHRAHCRPAEPSAGDARIPGRQPAAAEGAVRGAGDQGRRLRHGLAGQDGRRRARRRQLAARHRRCRADLCRRRQRQSRDPG